MPSFNLIDKAWISCRMLIGAEAEVKSLRQTLIEAPRIREIIGDTPLITIALHRMLLAVLHRLFGPNDADEWQRTWSIGSWNSEEIATYFTEHYERFDLFHEKYPFYQTPALDFALGGSVAGLIMAGNNTLFVHLFDHDPPLLTPAEAARYLIAFQSFDFGGTKTHEPNQQQDKFTDAAPLIQTAVELIRGGNLFETLMINLHRYDGESGEPFQFAPERDLPAWERGEPTKPMDRRPEGYLDLLTWQSRRIRLQAEEVNGEIRVRNVVIMKGYQFPDGFQLQEKETMVAFKKNKSATQNQRPWIPLGFEEGRALWRDSLAIFQSLDNEQIRPRLMGWLNDLVSDEAISAEKILPVDFYGLAAERGKLLFWRHERLIVPAALLGDMSSLGKLNHCLQLAENIGQILVSSSKTLARLLLLSGSGSDTKRLSRQETEKINDLAASFDVAAFYWARLEPHFKLLLTSLPQARANGAAGREANVPLRLWVETLRKTARAAFEQATRSLDQSARNLKAVVTAERTFNWQMNETLKTFNERFGIDVLTEGEA